MFFPRPVDSSDLTESDWYDDDDSNSAVYKEDEDTELIEDEEAGAESRREIETYYESMVEVDLSFPKWEEGGTSGCPTISGYFDTPLC